MSKEITILLADDHPVVRHGLRTMLERVEDFRIVAETGDGLEVLKLVESLRPMVLILDLVMPGIHGLAITEQIHKRFPETSIVILSMLSDLAYVWEALNKGAIAYVVKDSTSADLVKAVKAAAARQRFLSAPLSEAAVQSHGLRTRAGALQLVQTLTERERQVLQLVAEGNTNKQTAARLDITEKTVEKHRANLMRKLEVADVPSLMRVVINQRLVIPSQDLDR